MNLTLKDRKLITALAHNGRATYIELGKAAGLHRQSAKERVRKLEQNGIIKGYESALNFFRLGLSHFEAFFTFNDFTGESKERLIKYFVDHPFTRWVGEATIHPHLRVNFLAVSNQHFEEIIVGVESDLKGEIAEFTFNTVLDHLKHMPGVTNMKDPKHAYQLAEEERNRIKPFLDHLDIEILEQLTYNARISLVELASNVEKSIETVRQRIKLLEEKRVILKYNANYDLDRIDKRVWTIMYVRMKQKSPEVNNRVFSWLHAHPQVSNSHRLFGESHFGLTFVTEDAYELNDLVHQFRSEFSDNIDRMSVIWMIRGYKYPKVGKGIFEILRQEATKEHGPR